MDQYAGRLLADRYRLPRPPSEAFELVESRAFDTASGHEVYVRQVPLPEVVEAEVLDGPAGGHGPASLRAADQPATRAPDDPVVRRALEAAVAAAALPDHARLDQIFDVFVQGDGLWIVSELVPARSLATFLAEERLSPYRAAEVAADLLAALRVVHAHRWTHRNITSRTVLVCDDGRVLLTGLAAGAAEEVLCGYDPFPVGPGESPVGGSPAALGSASDQGGSPDQGGASDQSGASFPLQQSDRDPAPLDHVPAPGVPGVPAPGGDQRLSFDGSEDEQDWHRPPPGWNAPGAPGALLPDPADGTPPPGDQSRPVLPGGAGQDGPDFSTVGAGGGESDGTGFAPDDSAAADPTTRVGPRYREHADLSFDAPGNRGLRASPGEPGEPGDSNDPGASGTPSAPGTPGAPGTERTVDGAPGGLGPAPHRGQPSEPGGQGPGQWGDGRRPPQGVSSGPSPAALERASRSGAIAAYRAGTRAGADAVSGRVRAADGADAGPVDQGGADQGGLAARVPEQGGPHAASSPHETAAPPRSADSSGPTELPGRPRPSRSVPTGWESAPPRSSSSGTGHVPEQAPTAEGGAQESGESPAPTPNAPAAPGSTPVAARSEEPDRSAVSTSWAAPGQAGEETSDRDGGGQTAAARPAAGPGVTTDERPSDGAGQVREPQPGVGTVPNPVQRYRGPDSARAAERARQARMTTVGAVTERWAPEQAGPVYDHWQLAPPVGPAADLWALGALLFRAVQGHPPYPEETTAELTQAVCAEPPAFAEECGALRPVIESLLRQDPTERPSAEELRGWLRSIIRSAPEPDVGRRTAGAPRLVLEAGADTDPSRLPIVRDRGELVSRRGNRGTDPRRIGRLLVALVFLLAAGGVAYAMLGLPQAEEGAGTDEADSQPGRTGEPVAPGESPDDSPGDEASLGGNGSGGSGSEQPNGGATEPSDPAPDAHPDPAPEGFETVHDPSGFRIAVPEGWERSEGQDGQVVFRGGDGLELVVVPGRDATSEFGDAPMDYQLVGQPELQDYRDGDWSSSNNLQDVMVGNVRMAEGTFLWDGDDGQEFVRNRAMIMDDSYHVVLLRGPEEQQNEAGELYETAADSYRLTDG